MKHILFSCFLLTCSFPLMSQDWAPVYPGDTTIYRTDSSEFFAHTLWVDSVEQSTDGQIWQFNPSNHLCDTCDLSRYCLNFPLLINQPFPFGAGLILEDSSRFLFDQGEQSKILLLPTATQGTTWLMDSINMISATISVATEDSVWGLLDSMKTIQLSSGDSILLSKNYGMLSFPDSISRGDQIQLAGILNRELGEEILDFWDIYDFQVGDVLYYSYGGGSAWGGSGSHQTKATILSRNTIADTIWFTVLMKGKSEYSSVNGDLYSEVGFDSLIQTWTFTNDPDHIINSLPNQLAPNEFRSEFDFQYNHTLWKTTDYIDFSLTAPIKVSSTVKEVEVMYDIENTNCSLDTAIHPNLVPRTSSVYDFQHRYQKGLGQTLYSFDGFESGCGASLVGYIRDGDTVGTVYTDEYLFVSTAKEIDPGSVQVYPNPTRNTLTISLSQSKYLPATVYLRDLHGRIVLSASLLTPETTLQLAELPTALYHLEVVSDQGATFRDNILVLE